VTRTISATFLALAAPATTGRVRVAPRGHGLGPAIVHRLAAADAASATLTDAPAEGGPTATLTWRDPSPHPRRRPKRGAKPA